MGSNPDFFFFLFGSVYLILFLRRLKLHHFWSDVTILDIGATAVLIPFSPLCFVFILNHVSGKD